MFKLYIRVGNHRNHPSKHGAVRPWQHLRRQGGGDGEVEEPPETARSREEVRRRATSARHHVHKQPNSQTQPQRPNNPKPQNLQHKSMRPWQHLRKQEGGDGEVEEPPETARSREEVRRRATSARHHVHKQPNPTPTAQQPETPEPTAQKHGASP